MHTLPIATAGRILPHFRRLAPALVGGSTMHPDRGLKTSAVSDRHPRKAALLPEVLKEAERAVESVARECCGQEVGEAVHSAVSQPSSFSTMFSPYHQKSRVGGLEIGVERVQPPFIASEPGSKPVLGLAFTINFQDAANATRTLVAVRLGTAVVLTDQNLQLEDGIATLIDQCPRADMSNTLTSAPQTQTDPVYTYSDNESYQTTVYSGDFQDARLRPSAMATLIQQQQQARRTQLGWQPWSDKQLRHTAFPMVNVHGTVIGRGRPGPATILHEQSIYRSDLGPIDPNAAYLLGDCRPMIVGGTSQFVIQQDTSTLAVVQAVHHTPKYATLWEKWFNIQGISQAAIGPHFPAEKSAEVPSYPST